MLNFIIIFGLALISSFALTPILIGLAAKYNFFDKPQPLKIHQMPTARIGGIAIYFSFVISLMTAKFIFNYFDFGKTSWIFLTATLIFAAGLADDFLNINPRLKLVLVTLAGFFLLGAFPLSYPWWGQILPYLIMFIWLDYLSNSFNLLDGLDGLCSGVSLIAAVFFMLISFLTGKIILALLALILMGALTGFLKFNLPRARIFLGDGGSYFIGGLLAVVAIGLLETISWKIIAILWILGVPVVDTSLVLLRRVMIKTDPLLGDLTHSYNLLLEKIKSPYLVLTVLYSASIVSGLIGLFLFFAPDWLLISSLILPFCVLFYMLKFSKYFKKK